MPQAAKVHRAKQRSTAPPRRKKQQSRPYDKALWRTKIRPHQLSIEPLCRMCRKEDKYELATDVDHIDGDNTNNEPSNLQSLCRSHHSRKTAIENGGFGNWSKPSKRAHIAMPVVVVSGDPGSGKTTYVQKHRGSNDIVFDLDEISKAINPEWERYSDRPQSVSCLVKDWRDMLISRIKRGLVEHTAWIIITDQRKANDVAKELRARLVDCNELEHNGPQADS